MGPPKSSSGSSFDPACDQCRLKKIKCGREQPKCLTCRRAGGVCTFSDRGKRFSQSNIIINNLEEVKSRLCHIEKNLSQLKAASQPNRSGTTAQDQSLVPETFVSSDHEMDGMSIDSRADRSTQGIHNLMNGQHHGSSSLASLLRDVYLALESNLDSKVSSRMDDGLDKNTQQCLAIIEDLSKSLLADDSWDLSGEPPLPPKLPPKGLLDASLESYFRQVNPTLPVFDEDFFYDNIQKNYEVESDQAHWAWIMCFNNVILQTLDARITSSFTKKIQNKASSPLDMEAKILSPFLINLRRAIGRLDCFHQPSLVSVQALMSMCLVTQDNFQYRLASLLLQQACFVAKSIGLHQPNALSADHSPAEKSQRVRVFWTLYIIDKSITSMNGQSCYMPLFDCNVGLPEKVDIADPCLERLLPRIELALIQEDAYKRLHLIQPDQAGTERRSSIFHLSKKLTDWAFKYCDLFEEMNKTWSPIDGSSPPSALTLDLQANTALTYHFHITRIMVHRPSKNPSDKRQCREDAVACVRLLQRLPGDSNSENCSVLLRQIIRDHPLVPFFILFHHALQSPQSEISADDLRLMVLATDILQRVPGFTRLRAYVTYLSSCCRAFASLVHKPAHVNPIAAADSLKPDTYSTDDPFEFLNDLPFDTNNNNSQKNNTRNDSNKRGKINERDKYSEKNSESYSLNDTLARGQHWPAIIPLTDPLALHPPQPDSSSAPSWTKNFDFANIANSDNLANSIYRTDNELHPPRPSASPMPVQQYQQQDNQGNWPKQQQPQQLQRQLWHSDRQPQQQWPQEMGMGFLMAEDGVSKWGESLLN